MGRCDQKPGNWVVIIERHAAAYIWVEDSWINYSVQGLEDPNRPFPFLITIHGMQLMTIILLPH